MSKKYRIIRVDNPRVGIYFVVDKKTIIGWKRYYGQYVDSFLYFSECRFTSVLDAEEWINNGCYISNGNKIEHIEKELIV